MSKIKKKVKRISHEGEIGVRFSNSPKTIYSYKVKDIRKVYLGQELVVTNEYGTNVVFVVQIGGEFDVAPYKFITRKVEAL